jgi:hypothetical protein
MGTAAAVGQTGGITKTANHFRYSLASLAIIRGSIIEYKDRIKYNCFAKFTSIWLLEY